MQTLKPEGKSVNHPIKCHEKSHQYHINIPLYHIVFLSVQMQLIFQTVAPSPFAPLKRRYAKWQRVQNTPILLKKMYYHGPCSDTYVMYIYIYIHIYIYILQIDAYVHIYIYIYTYIYMYIHIFHMYVYIYIYGTPPRPTNFTKVLVFTVNNAFVWLKRCLHFFWGAM